MTTYDKDRVKQAARGQWRYILGRICNLTDEQMSAVNKGVPCLKCGGDDRFAVFSDFDETGGVNCRHCHYENNQDGFATIQWILGVDFPTAVGRVALDIGYNEPPPIPNTPVATETESATPSELAIDASELAIDAMVRIKHVPRESLAAYGAQELVRLVTFPQFNTKGKRCSTFTVKPFSKNKLDQKGKNEKGKPAGFFLPLVYGEPRMPAPGELWYVTEGVKDSAALHSLGLNAFGTPGTTFKDEFAPVFTGVDVVLVPDRDVGGERMAWRIALLLRGIASSVKIATLPAELKPDSGEDVRDILQRPNGRDLVLKALADAKLVEETKEEIKKRINNLKPRPQSTALPEVFAEGDERPLVCVAEQLGRIIAPTQTYFRRGRAVSQISSDDGTIHDIRPENFITGVERYADLKRLVVTKSEILEKRFRCGRAFAESIIRSDNFLQQLPRLRLVSRCPVIIERNGQLIEVTGFDPLSGVFARGDAAAQVAISEARSILTDVLSGFRFATEADRSRAFAAIITPGLVMGGLIHGRSPIDLGEADQSQTGKGYRNKLTAAIYNTVPRAITTRKAGGVGSIEESFDRALVAGETFIALDNVRGAVDSPAIESFCTEDTYFARTAYSPVTEIDPRRVALMFTSNRADMTTDLANRSSCVRILKQVDGFLFKQYPEGDVLDHVRANQPKFLGAVFAVIRAWHAAGKPRTNETRHDFRAWVQVLDWIVQNLLGGVPIMDGHRETQRRMTNPAMNWLRDVGLAVLRSNYVGMWLQAHDVVEILCADGAVEVPSLGTGEDIEDDAVGKRVLQQFGKKMKRCFVDSDSITIDQVVINREQYQDSHGTRYRYQVVEASPEVRSLPSLSPDEKCCDEQNIEIHGSAKGGRVGDSYPSPDNSPDAPLTTPLIDSRVSLDAPEGKELIQVNQEKQDTHTPTYVSIGNHQGIRGNQGAIRGNEDSSGECPHDEHKRELDPSLPGYTRVSCSKCGVFITYEVPAKEAAAA